MNIFQKRRAKEKEVTGVTDKPADIPFGNAESFIEEATPIVEQEVAAIVQQEASPQSSDESIKVEGVKTVYTPSQECLEQLNQPIPMAEGDSFPHAKTVRRLPLRKTISIETIKEHCSDVVSAVHREWDAMSDKSDADKSRFIVYGYFNNIKRNNIEWAGSALICSIYLLEWAIPLQSEERHFNHLLFQLCQQRNLAFAKVKNHAGQTA